MSKVPHIFWVYPSSQPLYRTKGEIHFRPGSVLPKLSEQPYRLTLLIPSDPTLLPKTKLSPGRVSRHVVHLGQPHNVELVKLSRGNTNPSIYMVNIPLLDPALTSGLFVKSALVLAQQMKKNVDLFHVFGWETSLLPLFLDMERETNRYVQAARTFLTVASLKDQGNFPPGILAGLKVPEQLFHPEGVEFYGKVNFLKAGLIFTDGIGLVDGGSHASRALAYRPGPGLDGLMDSVSFKVRRWASERSLRAHMEAYREILASPRAEPLLPKLLRRLPSAEESAKHFVDSWGPPHPDRYGKNALSLMIQSPRKGYAYWEWPRNDQHDYGIMLEEQTTGKRSLLAGGLPALGEFWMDMEPDKEYVAELVGWNDRGEMRTLLRSNAIRTPRVTPSLNRNAVFIDVRSRKKLFGVSSEWWRELMQRFRMGSGSAAWEWEVEDRLPLPSSLPSSTDWVGSSGTFETAAEKKS